MERASDRKSCFHCTWNRDAVWKISEDHDSADFSGWVLVCDGAADIVFYIIMKLGLRKIAKRRRQRRKILLQTVQMM